MAGNASSQSISFSTGANAAHGIREAAPQSKTCLSAVEIYGFMIAGSFLSPLEHHGFGESTIGFEWARH